MGNEFFTVERVAQRRPLRWRGAAIAISILLLIGLSMCSFDQAQISGKYQGWLDNPATGKTGVKMVLQQIGSDVSGNCTLSKIYGYKLLVQGFKVSGTVSGTTVKIQGELKEGGRLILVGYPSTSGDFRLFGQSHFEGSKAESSAESPCLLNKVKTLQ